jgi:hypothetical protein
MIGRGAILTAAGTSFTIEGRISDFQNYLLD